jgi:hypothetical protein
LWVDWFIGLGGVSTSGKPNKPVDPQVTTSQQLQVHAAHTKTASTVLPEDVSLTPETCKGLKHNKVIAKMKVY